MGVGVRKGISHMWSTSVLGPLFFLIYINDMIRAGKGLGYIFFADDTNIFAKG